MRIRSIKPEFWRSDDIDSLDLFSRLLFIGLWSYVDDNGVGIYSVKDIVSDLFAGDLMRDSRETVARVSGGLQTLVSHNLISVYSAECKGVVRKFVSINSWSKHQRVDKPNKERYPRPSNDSQPFLDFEIDEFARDSRDSRDSPATGTEEQRNRGTEEQINNIPVKPVSRTSAYSEDFEAFWKTYPDFRRKEKPKAWAEWKKAIKRASAQEIMSGLQAYMTGDITYAPYPAKWLKADSWNDGPDISHEMQSSKIVTRTQKAQAEWDEDRRIREQIQAQQNGGGQLALTN